MRQVFEDKYAQKLIALSADSGYNLATSFDWEKVSDLNGRRIAGAGLNLKWVENAGAIPVQSSLPEAFKAMQTGFYDGWIMFPVGWINYRLYDVGKYYTEVGFGSITWHGITINKERFDALPKEVQDILLEVGREYEAMTGSVNEAELSQTDRRTENQRHEGAQVAGLGARRMGQVAGGLAARKGQGTRRRRPAGDAGSGSDHRRRRKGRPSMAGALYRARCRKIAPAHHAVSQCSDAAQG